MYAYYTFSLRYAEKSISKIYIKVRTDCLGWGGRGRGGEEPADRIERYTGYREILIYTRSRELRRA